MIPGTLPKWIAACALAALLLAPAAAPPPARAASDLDPSIPVMPRREAGPALASDPSSVIVKYREAAAKSPLARDSVRGTVGATLARAYETLPAVEALALAPGAEVDAAIAALEADPRVEYAEPNFVVSTFGVPSDSAFGAQWALHNTGQTVADYPSQGAGVDVDAPEAWEYGTGSAEVVVAIVDEGLDVTHPDLAPNVWTNPGELPDNGVDDDANGFVDDVHGWDFAHDDETVFDGARDQSNSTDFHGTHTGGTVGAAGDNGIGVAGVCWNVRLMSLKFLEGSGLTSNAIACIDYAVAMKRRGVNLRAINASWGGGGYSDALQEAIAAAGALDVLFCAASGNGGDDGRADNIDSSPVYPAGYPLANIVSVGAWTRYDQAASFSNYGASSVDLMAPGGLIASTGPNGTYYYSSGTSMAAPHVTGAVALVASIAPSLSAAEIKEILLGTTAAVRYSPATVTGGRLSLVAAVEAAVAATGGSPGGDDEEEPPPPPPPPSPVLLSAKFDKRRSTLFVEGHTFTESAVIEVDGVALPVMRLAPRDRLSDGTYVRVGGKAPGRMKFVLPKRTVVRLTVLNADTGARSAPLSFSR